MHSDSLTPELMLRAYASGVFPMAESREDDEVFWVDPRQRGIIPLRGFHISRTLRKTILSNRYDVTVDKAFSHVVEGCAERDETWINHDIQSLYADLHDMGRAHSMEVWSQGALVGGVYGVALGGAFFGESMFSRARDASKVALAFMVDRVRYAGFTLFDTQFITDHLSSLGGVEISRADYRGMLAEALNIHADFDAPGPLPSAQALVQRMTQTS